MDNGYLKKRFSELSETELLLVVNENSKDYTNEALQIAKEEIKKRSLTEKAKVEISNEVGNKTKETYICDNGISKVIKTIGVIIIFTGIIFGLLIMITSSDKLSGIGLIISTFVSGILFLGLGEIINLLHQINERQKMN